MANKFEYIRTAKYADFSSIELEDPVGMVKLAEAHKIKFVFVTEAGEKDAGIFFFPVGATVYTIARNGYETLEDYAEACTRNFPVAKEYYEAKEGGYKSYNVFTEASKVGKGSKEDFEEARKTGFVKGFEAFSAKYGEYKNMPHAKIPEGMDSAVKLHAHAKEKGFESYTEFEEAIKAGFPDTLIKKDALAKGFEEAADFFAAMKGGFSGAVEYKDARGKMIPTQAEYDNYITLKEAMGTDFSHDEAQLITLLQARMHGDKLDLKEIKKLLNKEQESYKRTFEGEDVKILPLWYTRKLEKEEAMEDFLSSAKKLKKIGAYNKKKKRFYVMKASRGKVVVDGSNAAFGTTRQRNAKPTFANLRLVLDELVHREFTEITVVVDASLRHRVTDPEGIEKVKSKGKYMQVPANTDADEFIIKIARKAGAYIVTNDTFKDYREKDKWVKKNIDRLRIPFMINDGRVMLSGLD